MLLETTMLVLAAAALAAYMHSKNRRQEFSLKRHQDELVCVVAFHDRRSTLPLIDAYFAETGIRILNLEQSKDGMGERSLFTHIYRLHLPEAVEQSDVVSRISAIDTVQSVQIRPM